MTLDALDIRLDTPKSLLRKNALLVKSTQKPHHLIKAGEYFVSERSEFALYLSLMIGQCSIKVLLGNIFCHK